MINVKHLAEMYVKVWSGCKASLVLNDVYVLDCKYYVRKEHMA